MSNGGPQLDTFSSVVEAEAKFLDAASQAQLRAAESLALEVAAEGDAVIVQQKREVLHQLWLTYARLRHAYHTAEDRIAVLEKHIKRASWLVQGERLFPDLVSQCWMGVWALATSVPSALSLISKRIEDRRGSNFCHNRVPDEVVKDLPESTFSVGGMITYCSKHLLMPKVGSPPMEALLALLNELASAAGKKQAEILAKLHELETGTYTTFDPLKIDSLDAATAAKASRGAG
jgi:hypothetical protein